MGGVEMYPGRRLATERAVIVDSAGGASHRDEGHDVFCQERLQREAAVFPVGMCRSILSFIHTAPHPTGYLPLP